LAAIHSRQAEMILDQERDGFFERGKKKNFGGKKRGVPSKKVKTDPIPISHTSKTTQRKNIAQSNNNNTNTNNKNNNIKEEEEEQHFFDEDCHVVPEYVPVELIDANDVEQVSELYSSELYSSVNTGVEFFPSAAATTANVYVPTAKSQKRSSFEDFLGEFIGYEETIDDAIVPTF
jgi:hypothetical protein